MSSKPPKTKSSSGKLSREDRLAENLRANLRRRKAASRKKPEDDKSAS